MVVSRTSMKVATATRTAMIQGFASPYSPLAGASGIVAIRSGTDGDGGNDRHARSQFNVGTLIEGNLHRHTLHHFHIIARGVFGRQQTERGSAARLNAVDLAREAAAPERVYSDIDGLTGAHVGQLRFLEIGRNP